MSHVGRELVNNFIVSPRSSVQIQLKSAVRDKFFSRLNISSKLQFSLMWAQKVSKRKLCSANRELNIRVVLLQELIAVMKEDLNCFSCKPFFHKLTVVCTD